MATAAGQLASLARGFACARGVNAFANNAARHRGVLIEIFSQPLVDQLFDRTLDVAIHFPLVWPSN